jgi:F-type H+-transporting ATPase subunit gamma
MANLKELRNRITSVGSTMQITSAMKMVSAAKLKRAQDSIQQLRPYADKLREILLNISGSLEEGEGTFAQKREVKNVLLILVSSNRGLCGAFNANVVKLARAKAAEYTSQGKTVQLVTIGKKGFDGVKKLYANNLDNQSHVYDDLTYENVAVVAEKAMEAFAAGKVDRVDIIYNQFRNAAVPIPMNEPFLPIVVESSGEAS